MQTELLLLWSALVVFVFCGSLAIAATVMRMHAERVVLGLLVLGQVLITAAIALRWERLGHGPFVTMFEIITSNLWSLSLIYLLAYWRLPPLRPSAAVVMPILFIMMGWLLVTDPAGSYLPPTYHTIWLYIHIGFGKVFLGAVLVAVGLAGVILLRRFEGASQPFRRMPDNASLDELAYRFMSIGLIFNTLMLISGAIWAQDAWGRYWSWDPLETWAFITWLLLGLAIHIRLTLKIRPETGAVLVLAVFVLAFLTFFGVPFISTAPHKGAV